MRGFRRLGDKLFGAGLTRRNVVGARMVGGESTAPTLTISTVSVTGNVAAMQIVASEQVTGFVVGDITISAGGSLAGFATADNITFTVSWTLAVGANTMDIAAGVCRDLAHNENIAATQYALTYLVLQPDAAAGVDTTLIDVAPDTNYGTLASVVVGDLSTGNQKNRALLKFDLSSIPAGSTIYSAILSLYAITDTSTNARTYRVFRMLRAWVEAQATWNIYSTGNSWQTAGGFGALDCEQTDIGTRAFSATETLNQFKDFTLTPSAVQAMITGGAFTNNGFMVKADTEADDSYTFTSSDGATAGNRPKFAVVYRPS